MHWFGKCHQSWNSTEFNIPIERTKEEKKRIIKIKTETKNEMSTNKLNGNKIVHEIKLQETKGHEIRVSTVIMAPKLTVHELI